MTTFFRAIALEENEMDKNIKIERYEKSLNELSHLIGTEGKYAVDGIGRMALISAVLRANLSYFLFVGFYRVVGDDMLIIGPYQGEMIVCGTIPFGKGVCGACAARKETIIVDDVSKFPGYIACDSETKSEIVIPVFERGELTAVLDVDGASFADFDETDRHYLEEIVAAYFKNK
jgi:L-methionine (R)-S-oxide reductase